MGGRRDVAERHCRRARHPHLGLVAAIDLASRPDAVGKRAYEVMERAFHEHGLMFRITGDTIALSPPLIVSEDQIGEIVDKTAQAIRAAA